MSALAKSALIFVGAGLGANLRYWIGGWVQARWFSETLGGLFPGGTLVVNATGSLAMGLVLGLLGRDEAPLGWRLFLAVGVLGGYTTFSAFSAETVALLEARAIGPAAAYVAGSVALCVGFAGLGLLLARAIAGG